MSAPKIVVGRRGYMYCKTCGNLLNDTDFICGVCGTRVYEYSENKPVVSPAESIPTTVAEAPSPTQIAFTDVASSAAAFEKTSAPAVHERSDEPPQVSKFDFEWDNSAFPTNETKKTEKVEFIWNEEDAKAKDEDRKSVV
jgi:RNA polymerase subunit RPABC4/transcription elongation factor Spt4